MVGSRGAVWAQGDWLMSRPVASGLLQSLNHFLPSLGFWGNLGQSGGHLYPLVELTSRDSLLEPTAKPLACVVHRECIHEAQCSSLPGCGFREGRLFLSPWTRMS